MTCAAQSVPAHPHKAPKGRAMKLKTALTAILALVLTAGATIAKDNKRPSYRPDEIFQNVAAEHVRPLLANTAWVSSLWHDKASDQGGYVRIVWHGADGREHGCLTSFEGVSGSAWVATYSGRIIDRRSQNVRHPLKEKVFEGERGYQLLRYNGETGELTTWLGGAQRRWWKGDVGHLQARIPAVTWEICPDFPSAESLGAEVNTAQTSRYYRQLLAQDPGERILRPQYVNEHAHEFYGSKAGNN